MKPDRNGEQSQHDFDLQLTEHYDVERFNNLTRWAPWEWMVYEFEHGLSRPKPQIYPKPDGI